MKSGFYGIASSLSARVAMHKIEERQSLIGLQRKMELITDRDDRIELDIYIAEKNNDGAGRVKLEQEQAWLHSVGSKIGAEYNDLGGDMGIEDATSLSVLAAASSLYFGQKFFEVFRASERK